MAASRSQRGLLALRVERCQRRAALLLVAPPRLGELVHLGGVPRVLGRRDGRGDLRVEDGLAEGGVGHREVGGLQQLLRRRALRRQRRLLLRQQPRLRAATASARARSPPPWRSARERRRARPRRARRAAARAAALSSSQGLARERDRLRLLRLVRPPQRDRLLRARLLRRPGAPGQRRVALGLRLAPYGGQRLPRASAARFSALRADRGLRLRRRARGLRAPPQRHPPAAARRRAPRRAYSSLSRYCASSNSLVSLAARRAECSAASFSTSAVCRAAASSASSLLSASRRTAGELRRLVVLPLGLGAEGVLRGEALGFAARGGDLRVLLRLRVLHRRIGPASPACPLSAISSGWRPSREKVVYSRATANTRTFSGKNFCPHQGLSTWQSIERSNCGTATEPEHRSPRACVRRATTVLAHFPLCVMTSANDALEAACLEGDASRPTPSRAPTPRRRTTAGMDGHAHHHAAGGNALRPFGILLEHGADPRARNAGETPLHLVCNADTLIDFKVFAAARLTAAPPPWRPSSRNAGQAGAQVNARQRREHARCTARRRRGRRQRSWRSCTPAPNRPPATPRAARPSRSRGAPRCRGLVVRPCDDAGASRPPQGSDRGGGGGGAERGGLLAVRRARARRPRPRLPPTARPRAVALPGRRRWRRRRRRRRR